MAVMSQLNRTRWRMSSAVVLLAASASVGAAPSASSTSSGLESFGVPVTGSAVPVGVARSTMRESPDLPSVRTGAGDVPTVAMIAYRSAVAVMSAVAPRCKLEWPLLAAIGKVESDHGRTGGGQLDQNGVARPAIYGPRLIGTGGVARIEDSDAGKLDRDATLDRAVGPMQFLPSTWSSVAVDGDNDGHTNPQDIDDAAVSSALFLCAGKTDLSKPKQLRAAVLRYNHSDRYADEVLRLAEGYGAPLPGPALSRSHRPAVSTTAPLKDESRAMTPKPTPASRPTDPAPRKPAEGPKPAAPSPSQQADTFCRQELTASELAALGGMTACVTAFLDGGVSGLQSLLDGLDESLSTLLGGK